MTENKGQIIIYQTENEDIKVDVYFEDETFWMTQSIMAKLFNVQVPAISKHLKNIFEDGELNENSVISIMETTAKDGKNYMTKFYNLDAIIAVGYRVNSLQATRFRQWATKTLKEYIIKGFVINDDMLKNGKVFGKDYFKELLERVRSIRASERRIWLQITDIYAECSTNYDKNSPTTKYFYATIQNKFHYAITGKTAAEIIYEKSDAEKENMGLTTWKNAPSGRILKSDSTVAKNYLTEKEIRALERNISSYFDYIEDLIERENTFTMEEFKNSVNEFLNFRRYDILPDSNHGRISKKEADKKAHKEYDKFNKTQKIYSDFDKLIEKTKNKHPQ